MSERRSIEGVLRGLRWRGWSVRVRLGVVTALALVPALAVLILNARELRSAREAEIRAGVIEDARSVASELRSLVAGLETGLRVTAIGVQRRPVAADCQNYLADVAATLPAFIALAVYDTDGRITCASREVAPEPSYADRSYFAGAIAARGALFVGTYNVGRRSGEASLPIAFSLPNAPTDRRVVMGAISIPWLSEQLRQRGVSRGSSITIADRGGTIIFREPLSERFVGTRIPDEFQRLVRSSNVGVELVRSQDGTMRYLGFVPPELGSPWLYVSTGISVERSLALIEEALRLNVMLMAVAAVGSITAATLVGHVLIHKQLDRILSVTRAWRRGDLGTRTGMKADDGEIGMAGSALDDMVAALAERDAERGRAEEQRLILVRELQHRVKNTLAVVQAIAGQSLRGAPESRDLLEGFRARLAALATTYDLLTDENWRGASLRDVIWDAMAAQAPQGRITLTGPDLRIKPNASLAISLAIHELATNALKHGALSVPTGRVEVAWARETVDAAVLHLTWRERGGPVSAKPERSGFGTVLLTRILSQQVAGDTTLDWGPDGLSFDLRCPLAEVEGDVT